MSKIEKYYNSYWEKRLAGKDDTIAPIRDSIPKSLEKYSQYGSCLNLVTPKFKLLDLGCGEGNITELYRLRKDCDIHGLEVSDIALSKAGQRGVKARKWDLNEEPYPFPDNTFDVITSVDVPEHLINPLILIKEAYRMVKHDGSLIILVPNFARVANRLRMLFMGNPVDILHWGGYGDGMEHLHWFTKPKLEFFLKNIGFKTVIFHPVGLPYDFVFGLFGLHNWSRLLLVEAKKQ